MKVSSCSQCVNELKVINADILRCLQEMVSGNWERVWRVVGVLGDAPFEVFAAGREPALLEVLAAGRY